MIEHYLFEFEVNKRKFDEAFDNNNYEMAMQAYKAELELISKIHECYRQEANKQAIKAIIILTIAVILGCYIISIIWR